MAFDERDLEYSNEEWEKVQKEAEHIVNINFTNKMKYDHAFLSKELLEIIKKDIRNAFYAGYEFGQNNSK